MVRTAHPTLTVETRFIGRFLSQKSPDKSGSYKSCAATLIITLKRNFAELRALFPSTYKVGDMFVFDIGGNKLLLIAAIHFNARRVFIRAVLTHKEYDQGDWK